MAAMVEFTQRNLLVPRFLIPSALLLWLLMLYSSLVLIPGANAQTNAPCPTVWGDEKDAPTMAYKYYKDVPATGAMRGVHGTWRFTKQSLCQYAEGTVTYFQRWNDYDWNIYIDLKPNWENLVTADDIKHLREWTQAQKTSKHPAAEMIWEAVGYDQGGCGDGSQSSGGLAKPDQGDDIKVWGAKVYDNNWRYTELHRIYEMTLNGQTCTAALKDPV